MGRSRPRYDLANALCDWFVGGQFKREVSCFAAEGMGVVAMSTQDRAGHVEFDFFRIWEAMKGAPRMPKMAWMYHTHPPSFPYMSSEDANSVNGWTTALGMPIDMAIVSGAIAGTLHYRCLPGNRITLLGFSGEGKEQSQSSPLEGVLVAAMIGMSWTKSPCTAEQNDSIVVDLNRVIPVSFWDPGDKEKA